VAGGDEGRLQQIAGFRHLTGDMETRLPVIFVLGLWLLLAAAACGGGPARVATGLHPAQATPSQVQPALPSADPTPSALAQPTSAAPLAEARHDCESTGQPPAPTPTSASGFPGAPVTTAFILGSVCSAATGRPLRGAAISYALQTQSCAQGHQPWRCAATTITDADGHYRIAVYDPGDYSASVRLAGYSSGGGTVHIAGPGVVTRDWQLVPAA
jgi:Carboxypeptidase regulatory-like domain